MTSVAEIPDHDNMGFIEWAQRTSGLNDSRGIIAPESEARWQEWAVNFTMTVLGNLDGVPSPYGYSDWRSWVDGLINTLEKV